MDKIKIITDSTCDLPKNIVEELGIKVIPLSVNINSKSYKDGVDITFDELNEFISKTEDFPTTSQVNPDVFKDVYEKYLDRGYKVISIHVSNKLSATYQSASIAKNILDTKDIIIYDSLSVCAGLGMIVQEAADMVKRGYSLDEVCSSIEKGISNIKCCVIINNLTNLVRAGRISKTISTIGSMLGIKPVISVINGELVLVDKVRGKSKLASYLLNFIEENEIDDDTEIRLVYSKESILLDDLKKYLDDRGYKYLVVHVGCVVGAYSGEKCVGVFIKKN